MEFVAIERLKVTAFGAMSASNARTMALILLSYRRWQGHRTVVVLAVIDCQQPIAFRFKESRCKVENNLHLFVVGAKMSWNRNAGPCVAHALPDACIHKIGYEVVSLHTGSHSFY